MNLLLIGNFDAAEQADWAHWLRLALPAHRLFTAGDGFARADIDAAIVANPSPGSLQGLPRLRLIQSLWAGVDRLLADPTLPGFDPGAPDVPIARMVDPAMTAAMVQTALWATLALHRGFFGYARQQQRGQWQHQPQTRADECPVLVLGFGQMGQAVALCLAQQGYPVSAWRRGGVPSGAGVVDRAWGHGRLLDGLFVKGLLVPSVPSGIRLLHSPDALADAQSQARVVINLLPLTPDTRGLIDARWLARLPRGAGLVNLARGAHLVDGDLLAALDAGQIGHAVLDVFHTEPLPAGHRYWQHPQVTVLPHAAAMTDARSAAAVVARNIDALVAGGPLQNLVARDAGY